MGLLEPSLVIVSDPEKLPAVLGLKVTLMLQLAPGAIGVLQFVFENGAEVAIEMVEIGASPVLESVTV
jgi:hypothetical protein